MKKAARLPMYAHVDPRVQRFHNIFFKFRWQAMIPAAARQDESASRDVMRSEGGS